MINKKTDALMLTLMVALLMTACAQTSSTQSPSVPQPESPETSKTSSQDSAAGSQSEKQGSQAEPQSSHQESSAVSQPESQAPRTKTEPSETAATENVSSQAQKTPSSGAPESKSPKSESEWRTDQASAEPSADDKLAKARENLRISQETEKRIDNELKELKASGRASEAAIRDYETYLKSVEAMTAENRKIVEQMEAAYAKNTTGAMGPDPPPADQVGSQSKLEIPEEGTVDEVAALDRQLDSSLAKFDGMLLKEMDEIRAGSSKRLQDLAEEAAEAAKRLKDRGYEGGTSGSQDSGESQSGESDESDTGSNGQRTGTETAAREGSRKGGEGQSGQDQRRVSYDDDDIVARQLREAAENETDPELKEKLWKEYEEYKRSR